MQFYSVGEIETMLNAWGRWARSRLGVEWSSCNILGQFQPVSCTGSEVGITDDQALRLEAALEMLSQYDDGQHLRVLLFHAYVCDRSDRQISDELQLGRSRVHEDLSRAKAWLAGFLMRPAVEVEAA